MRSARPEATALGPKSFTQFNGSISHSYNMCHSEAMELQGLTHHFFFFIQPVWCKQFTLFVLVMVVFLLDHLFSHLTFLQRYMLVVDTENEQLFDLIQQLLIFEPRKRMTASEALKQPFFSSLTKINHSSVQSKRSMSSQSSTSSETE